MRLLLFCLVLLLSLPALPAAARERCVENPSSVNAEAGSMLYFLRGYPPGAISPEELVRLMELEMRANWAARVGAGNGWVVDAPNSCVLYYDASNEPVSGTRLYLLESAETAGEAFAPGDGQSALVIKGPARVRSGPGLEHGRLRWCIAGTALTVWTPAVDGWLRARCRGGSGWIHESLVGIDSAAEQAVVIKGPAHIRSGPGAEHAHVRWCVRARSLTVWRPARDGWLRAECHGARGWIHESLVSIDG